MSVAALLGEEEWAEEAQEVAQAQGDCLAHTDFSADAVLLLDTTTHTTNGSRTGGSGSGSGGNSGSGSALHAAARVAVLNDALAYIPAPGADAALLQQRRVAERRLVGRLGRVLYELFTGRAYRPAPSAAAAMAQQGGSRGLSVGSPRNGGDGGGGGEDMDMEEEEEGEDDDAMDMEDEEEEEEDGGYLRELPELGSLVHALLAQQQQQQQQEQEAPPMPPFFPLRRALQALARVGQRRCAKVALERVEKQSSGACVRALRMDVDVDVRLAEFVVYWMPGRLTLCFSSFLDTQTNKLLWLACRRPVAAAPRLPGHVHLAGGGGRDRGGAAHAPAPPPAPPAREGPAGASRQDAGLVGVVIGPLGGMGWTRGRSSHSLARSCNHSLACFCRTHPHPHPHPHNKTARAPAAVVPGAVGREGGGGAAGGHGGLRRLGAAHVARGRAGGGGGGGGAHADRPHGGPAPRLVRGHLQGAECVRVGGDEGMPVCAWHYRSLLIDTRTHARTHARTLCLA